MPAWRKTLLTVLALALLALTLPTAALADEHDAFIELSTGDLTDFEVWEDSYFSPTGNIYYNRVDGLLLYMGARYRSESRLHPRVRAMWAWPSSRSDSYYRLDIEQPVFDQDSFSFGVNLYDRSSWNLEDEEAISDFDNNMHAVWAKIDDRDYFRSNGVTVFARHKLTPELMLEGEYRSDKLSSLSESQSVWTVFEGSSDWRENPALMVGVLEDARGARTRRSWSACSRTRASSKARCRATPGRPSTIPATRTGQWAGGRAVSESTLAGPWAATTSSRSTHSRD